MHVRHHSVPPALYVQCCIDRLGYICCAKGRTSRYDYELLHLEKALRFSALRHSSGEADDEVELTERNEEGEVVEPANNHSRAVSALGYGNAFTCWTTKCAFDAKNAS